MSSAAEIFRYPGELGMRLILSILEFSPGDIDQELYVVGSMILALIAWSWIFRICIAVVKKTFGFHDYRGQR